MLTAKQLDKFFDQLKKLTDEEGRHPTLFRRDGKIILSAEDGGYFADYYGEYRLGYPWVHPKIEKWAKDRGLFWEWENPGCLALYWD